MKWLNSLGLVTLFIVLCIYPIHSERFICDKTFNLRILLRDGESGSSWTISSQGGFKVRDPKTGSEELLEEKTLEVLFQAGVVRVNGHALALDTVELVPVDEFCSFEQHDYPGYLVLARRAEKIYLINKVDVETYVYCVLFAESIPTASQEYQKGMATTIRTYAIDKAKSKREHMSGAPSDLFDLRPTNVHQTYLGLPKNQKESLKELMRNAVRATAGEVMVWKDGNVIMPMYDICCMHVPPSKIAGVNFKVAPWLARSYACHYCERSAYCKRNKFNKWSFKMELAEVEQRISKALGTKVHVLKVHVAKRDTAGLVRSIRVETNKGTKLFTGSQFYGMFKKLRSTYFSVERRGRWVIFFDGQGFGHGLGLCQQGFQQFLKEKSGVGYRDGLRYYFPGVSFGYCRGG